MKKSGVARTAATQKRKLAPPTASTTVTDPSFSEEEISEEAQVDLEASAVAKALGMEDVPEVEVRSVAGKTKISTLHRKYQGNSQSKKAKYFQNFFLKRIMSFFAT